MDMARSFVTVETAGNCHEDLSRPAHGNGAGAKGNGEEHDRREGERNSLRIPPTSLNHSCGTFVPTLFLRSKMSRCVDTAVSISQAQHGSTSLVILLFTTW